MEDFFPQLPSFFLNEPSTNFGQIVPVNIKQNENGYVLDVIAPGFNKEDFKIHLEKNLLTISAETQAGEENKNEKDVRKEYTYQSFKRSFTIDEKIDTEKIEAKYENGILRLNLKNKEEVKKPTKQITIQ
jgi:HSP20 family protein